MNKGDAETARTMYRKMVFIRRFEEKLVELSQIRGRVPGMQILAIDTANGMRSAVHHATSEDLEQILDYLSKLPLPAPTPLNSR